VALYLAAFTFYSAGYLLVRHSSPARWHGPFIIVVALAVRIVLFPAGMIQESDAYRYLLDGHVLSAGINPYQFTPAECQLVLAGDPNMSGPSELVGYMDTIRDGAVARTVLDRISYPQVVTIYPPLA